MGRLNSKRPGSVDQPCTAVQMNETLSPEIKHWKITLLQQPSKTPDPAVSLKLSVQLLFAFSLSAHHFWGRVPVQKQSSRAARKTLLKDKRLSVVACLITHTSPVRCTVTLLLCCTVRALFISLISSSGRRFIHSSGGELLPSNPPVFLMLLALNDTAATGLPEISREWKESSVDGWPVCVPRIKKKGGDFWDVCKNLDSSFSG